jgi:hypothetical protein
MRVGALSMQVVLLLRRPGGLRVDREAEGPRHGEAEDKVCHVPAIVGTVVRLSLVVGSSRTKGRWRNIAGAGHW